MVFTVLNQKINKALTLCGYQSPTPIQAKAIPIILEGKDVVACSQTGSGKTAAFVLPALHRLSLQQASKHTKILILTPTRELANQIMQAARQYGKFLKFNIISLVGGMPYGPQNKDLERGAEIIIATPGRLMDHINNSRNINLSYLEMLILDEADRMLDMGFIDDVNYIAKLLPNNRQTLLFSATVDKSLAKVVHHLLKNPIRVDMSNEKISVPQIKQEFYKTDTIQHKMSLLTHLLKNIYKAIIFTATKVSADKLAVQLSAVGYKAAALHGDLRQNIRNRRIDEFRRGKVQFLVATDVAARGIDINDVTHVINFDLPRSQSTEDYVHRIGRTGRAGKTGMAISFMLPADKKILMNIERFTKQRFQVLHMKTAGVTEIIPIPQIKEKDPRISFKEKKKKSYSNKNDTKISNKNNRNNKNSKPSRNSSSRNSQNISKYENKNNKYGDKNKTEFKSTRHPKSNVKSFKNDYQSANKTSKKDKSKQSPRFSASKTKKPLDFAKKRTKKTAGERSQRAHAYS